MFLLFNLDIFLTRKKLSIKKCNNINFFHNVLEYLSNLPIRVVLKGSRHVTTLWASLATLILATHSNIWSVLCFGPYLRTISSCETISENWITGQKHTERGQSCNDVIIQAEVWRHTPVLPSLWRRQNICECTVLSYRSLSLDWILRFHLYDVYPSFFGPCIPF